MSSTAGLGSQQVKASLTSNADPPSSYASPMKGVSFHLLRPRPVINTFIDRSEVAKRPKIQRKKNENLACHASSS